LGPWSYTPYPYSAPPLGPYSFSAAARRLESAGHGPAQLFVSGRRAPSLDPHGDWQPSTDEEVVAEIRRLNGTGDALLEDQEMLRMILPALRADYGAVRSYRYRPGPALDCPVTAFTGDRDPKAEVGQVRAWHTHTTSGFELSVLPGGHFFLVDQQEMVLRTVEEQLRRAVPSAVAS
ncbi:thioesterase domain-containing protein, partial [Streptomyces rubiginosohelvolus]|uniref:thioesterase II family protein n=1 Tax=Streptomyces rubiginosohelvolus TaxID=67362 RepID=UPI0033A8104B